MKLNHYGKAKTLQDLGLDFQAAVQFLNENNIPIILTEEDKYITPQSGEYKGLEDFILVRKTNFPPKGSRIKSAKEVSVMHTGKITIDGKEYSYLYPEERNTVHFSVNDEVSFHAYGQWDDTKYAILIPFTDIPKEQIGMAASVDTFTLGGVNLTGNSWILCPKGEGEEIKKSNHGIKVIEYEGESVIGYPPALLSAIGYRAESVGMWSWANPKSQEEYNTIIEKAGFRRDPHTFTRYGKDESMLDCVNSAVAIFSTIKNNGLVKREEDISNIYEQLNRNCNPSLDGILNKAMEDGFSGLQILYERLETNGIRIPDVVKSTLSNISSQAYTSIKIESSVVIPVTTDLSEADSKAAEDLKVLIESYNERQEAIYNSGGTIRDLIIEIVGKFTIAEIYKTRQMEEQETIIGR